MRKNFTDKTKGLFKQIILIIVVVAGLLSFLIFRIYQRTYLYGSLLVHKIATSCECAQMAQLFSMHPFIFGSLLAVSASIAAFISWVVYRLIKIIIQTRKFSMRYLIHVKTRHSSKLRQAIADLCLDKNKIVEVKDSKPVVFCYGFWRPKVCISDGLIKILLKDELEAVLLHEDCHMLAGEPAKLFIIKLFYSIFFFFPGLKICVNKYVIFSELAADERATNNFTDRSKLARAILKMSQAGEKYLFHSGLALSFFTSTIAERVNKLSDNAYVPKFRVPGRGFLLGLCSLVFIISPVIVLLTDSSLAFAMHNNGGCATGFKQNQSAVSTNDMNDNRQICSQSGIVSRHLQGCSMNR